jgi:hypothetical protein
VYKSTCSYHISGKQCSMVTLSIRLSGSSSCARLSHICTIANDYFGTSVDPCRVFEALESFLDHFRARIVRHRARSYNNGEHVSQTYYIRAHYYAAISCRGVPAKVLLLGRMAAIPQCLARVLPLIGQASSYSGAQMKLFSYQQHQI